MTNRTGTSRIGPHFQPHVPHTSLCGALVTVRSKPGIRDWKLGEKGMVDHGEPGHHDCFRVPFSTQTRPWANRAQYNVVWMKQRYPKTLTVWDRRMPRPNTPPNALTHELHTNSATVSDDKLRTNLGYFPTRLCLISTFVG